MSYFTRMSNSLYGESPANTPEERYEGFRELPMAVNTAQEQVTTVQIRGQAYRVPVDPYGMASKVCSSVGPNFATLLTLSR